MVLRTESISENVFVLLSGMRVREGCGLLRPPHTDHSDGSYRAHYSRKLASSFLPYYSCHRTKREGMTLLYVWCSIQHGALKATIWYESARIRLSYAACYLLPFCYILGTARESGVFLTVKITRNHLLLPTFVHVHRSGEGVTSMSTGEILTPGRSARTRRDAVPSQRGRRKPCLATAGISQVTNTWEVRFNQRRIR